MSYGKECIHPPVPGSSALDIANVSYRYPGYDQNALENITFLVNPGERVALVGPNGAGKSTLMKLAIGLANLQTGSITVYGNPAASCRHRVAVIPQRSNVDWGFPVTVAQVVMMGRYVHLGWFKRPGSEDRSAVDQALKTMEIHHLADRKVSELSGGQQQRVMLARTLAHKADLLLLDEPLNHVDIATQELMFHVIEELCSEGKTVIVSTHDLGVLKVHFSRALFIDRKIIADGPVEEVLTPEVVARAYGFHFHKEEDLTPWLDG